jgi:hypothetical protein
MALKSLLFVDLLCVKFFDMDFLQKHFSGVFELPLTEKRLKAHPKKVTQQNSVGR